MTVMSNVKSNIRIKSNVFLRSPESVSDGDHPERDAEFAAHIFDEAALKALKKRAEESGAELVLSNVQQRILNGERVRLSELSVHIAENTSPEILSVQISEEPMQAEESAEVSEASPILAVQMAEDPEHTAENTESAEFLSAQLAEDPDQPVESDNTADEIAAVQISEEPEQTAQVPENVAESTSADDTAPLQAAEEPAQAVENTTVTETIAESAAEPEQAPETAEASEIPAEQISEDAKLEKLTLSELVERGFGEKTLIVCADEGYVRYVSVLLHKNNIPHTLMNDPILLAPMRHFADVLWDCNDKVISRDNFTKRFTARCAGFAERADECFEAFCKFAGSSPADGVDIGGLARRILDGSVPISVFGERHGNVIVAAADDVPDVEFGRVYVLENGADSTLIGRDFSAEKALLTIADCPTVIGSKAGGFVAVNSAGSVAVFVNKDDADSLSFISGSVGDAVRKQAYISQNVKCGDEIRLELDGGVYNIIHNKTVIARTSEGFSERVLGEFGGKKYFEALPQSLEGLTVTDITAVVSCRSAEEFGDAVSPQFRNRNFWLGVEISGFANVIN